MNSILPITWRYFYPGEDLTACLSFRCHESDDVSAKNFDNPQNKTPKGGITLIGTLIFFMVTAFFSNAMFMEDANIWQPILFFSF